MISFDVKKKMHESYSAQIKEGDINAQRNKKIY